LAQVCGQVNDGTRGLECVRVELLDAGGKCVASTQSTTGGVWTILNLSPGTYQVRYPAQFQSNGKSLELPEQQRAQTLEIKAGELKCLDTASYGPESHILNVPVMENGRPAHGILVEVWSPGAPYPVLTKFTENGLASFPLKERGIYEVRVHQDRKAAASPLREIIEVQ
jgi:hypothetical protein